MSVTPDDLNVATIDLAIEGMHCGSCSALIQESIEEHRGVLGASVDLDAARATVRFDPTTTDSDDLCALVGDVGYKATLLSSS